MIKKMVLNSYIEAIKKEERIFALEMFIQRKFRSWNFDYTVKVEIKGNVKGKIKLYAQDNKLVGTFIITDYNCEEIAKDQVEIDKNKYWESDVRRLYFTFMKQTFNGWERRYIKELKNRTQHEIDYIHSL